MIICILLQRLQILPFQWILLIISKFKDFILTMEVDPQPQLHQPRHNHHQQSQESYLNRETPHLRIKLDGKNEFQYNADAIDENTLIPPRPKESELKSKPDIKSIKKKEQHSVNRIQELLNKKIDIRAEKFKFQRRILGREDSKLEALQGQAVSAQQLRDKLAEVKIQRSKKQEDLNSAIEKARANNQKIKEYKVLFKHIKQKYSDKMAELQHILLTKQLTKDEEEDLNNQIMLLNRQIIKAEGIPHLQAKLEHAGQLKRELEEEIQRIKKEKEPIEQEFAAIKQELGKRNLNIAKLKSQIIAEKSQTNEENERYEKQYQAWKQDKKARLDKLQAEVTHLRQENNKIWDDYQRKQHEYMKQKNYIDYISWLESIKSKKIHEKEGQSKNILCRKRRKQGHFQEYEREIQLINQLIFYLNNLRTHTLQDQEKLVSKTELKNKQKKSEEHFAIPFHIQSQFEIIKVLPLASSQQINEKLKELKERQVLFKKVVNEQGSQQQKRLAEEIRARRSKTAPIKQTKVQNVQQQGYHTN